MKSPIYRVLILMGAFSYLIKKSLAILMMMKNLISRKMFYRKLQRMVSWQYFVMRDTGSAWTQGEIWKSWIANGKQERRSGKSGRHNLNEERVLEKSIGARNWWCRFHRFMDMSRSSAMWSRGRF